MTHIDLSILLPSYNNVCVSLVQALQRQADARRGKLDKPFRYEILLLMIVLPMLLVSTPTVSSATCSIVAI